MFPITWQDIINNQNAAHNLSRFVLMENLLDWDTNQNGEKHCLSWLGSPYLYRYTIMSSALHWHIFIIYWCSTSHYHTCVISLCLTSQLRHSSYHQLAKYSTLLYLSLMTRHKGRSLQQSSSQGWRDASSDGFRATRDSYKIVIQARRVGYATSTTVVPSPGEWKLRCTRSWGMRLIKTNEQTHFAFLQQRLL